MRFVTYLSCIAVIAVFFTACKQKNTVIKSGRGVIEDSVIGTYSGDFNGSPIALTIRYVSGKHVSGYNMHKGLKRNIAGTMVLEGSLLHFHMTEPGTNKYDGVFDFLLDTLIWKGKGSWKPMHVNNDPVSFTLHKQYTEADEWSSSEFSDTLKNLIAFNPDKSCTYTYLVNDSTSTAQEIKITGTYTVDKKALPTYTIEWRPNDIFPSGKSVFTVFKKTTPGYDGEGWPCITILGREFTLNEGD